MSEIVESLTYTTGIGLIMAILVLVLGFSFARNFVEVTVRLKQALWPARGGASEKTLFHDAPAVPVVSYTSLIVAGFGLAIVGPLKAFDIHNPYPPPPLWYAFGWVAVIFIFLICGVGWGTYDRLRQMSQDNEPGTRD